jgi:hypothetical protein
VATNAKGFVAVLKFASTLLAIVLFLSAAAGKAAAQGDSGICTIATTCSEAFYRCAATRCPVAKNATCTAACKSQFNGCMKSGAFGGRDCRGKTLVRK